MTQSTGTSCAGRLHEANFCLFHDKGAGGDNAALREEKRFAMRFVHEEPVILETENGDLIGAVVMNYSKNGLYFESDLKIAQGIIVKICNEATLAATNGGGCCAEVRWSKPLGKKSTEYQYGTGVQYC
jgi:hypothetical protein